MNDNVLKSPYPQRELSEKEKFELFGKRMASSTSEVIQCSNCKYFSVVDRKMRCEKKLISKEITINEIVCHSKEVRVKR